MEIINNNQNLNPITYTPTGEASRTRSFLANVFLLMFIALGVSALFAWQFSVNANLLSYLIVPTTGGLTGLGMVTMFAPIGFVLLMSFGYRRLSAPALMGLFIAYAIINGITFSFILLAYTASSVTGCFLSASAMFGVMAFMGYTTNQDLTKFGRLLMMGVIGILIAMVINFFLHSSGLDYLISIIGVMVFVGLTAYDVQKLKRIGEGLEYSDVSAADTKKMSVLGALTLYLDFINIFLFLLRLFGSRRN
ncbi:Bax inhibitor-1/YccA family protein [Ginsengibacter hankyongi]|uniref:Bax inhibitor-1/YccA family protein n=1 Tax=Ginsengibacter hankyongi TaxID=2607284 RepID=A0A5J5ID54_9BACT|nr:Bax inhibitor-1/YccA family protein [Ginsengibacter hankyongi]KAA9037290.1 Bax inhibitor-1/YccA family protein [Ginsengibacter hankyongi]